MSQDAKKPLGRILLQQRAVTQAQLDAALEEARAAGVPLEVGAGDVARLRRHPVRTWYTQIESRRRSVRLMPVRRKPNAQHEDPRVQ